jgi:hypothetical protein
MFLAALAFASLTDPSELDELAIQCAHVQACAFAAVIAQSLSRELRDLIYEFVWDSHHVTEMDSYITKQYSPVQPSTKFIFEGHSCMSLTIETLTAFDVPFFVEKQFMGIDFAKEAAVRYLETLHHFTIDYRYLRVSLDTVFSVTWLFSRETSYYVCPSKFRVSSLEMWSLHMQSCGKR